MVKFFLSCEHGGYQIPKRYKYLFANSHDILKSHRGWDIGALELFNSMKGFQVHFSSYSEISRLLIELNRSLHKRSLFSAFSKNLSELEKQTIIKEYYWPFRSLFVEKIAEVVDKSHEVMHVSVHSFTPTLNGEVRNADIGLLYNPSHGREKEFAVLWKSILSTMLPHLKVRFNYPYLGKTDGHVAPLRQQFGKSYAGIELEMNNKLAANIKVINDIALSYRVLIHEIKAREQLEPKS